MLENTCQFVVGRLMEIRVTAGYRTEEDVDQMIAMMRARVATLMPNEKFAIAADWRGVRVMSPEAATRVREMLAISNPRVSRSTILISPESWTMGLQVRRLVQEAENSNRRAFADPAALRVWLSEVLSPEETARLGSFLAS